MHIYNIYIVYSNVTEQYIPAGPFNQHLLITFLSSIKIHDHINSNKRAWKLSPFSYSEFYNTLPRSCAAYFT